MKCHGMHGLNRILIAVILLGVTVPARSQDGASDVRVVPSRILGDQRTAPHSAHILARGVRSGFPHERHGGPNRLTL
jgi:hypothetical protein